MSEYKIYCILLFFSISTLLKSQELSTILDQKPLLFSGSFSVNQNAAFRNVAYSSSNPYSLFLNGNATATFYGISLPFSFSYSNQQVNYTQPFNFNQFGMQPSYKWVKAYIGYNSMSFSPYSLNGHQFLGGGVELSPPNFGLRVSFMYGRLIKAVKWDSAKITSRPYFQRNGIAAKIGYSGKKGEYYISVFNALDKISSINTIPDSLGIAPQENMIYTMNFSKTFFDKIMISGLFAESALTQDIRQLENSIVVKKDLFFLLNPNSTTSYAYALKGAVDYIASGYTIGIAYEKIQPNYSTLGSYYSNNDLENIALTFSKQLLEGKLNIAGSAGSQKNNLDKSKLTTSNQFLGNLNISYSPTQRIAINSTYSNYTFFTYMRTPFDQINTTDPYKNIDTLNFTQISQSASINSSIILGSLDDKNKRRMLMISISYQQSANRQEGIGIINSSYFYQGNLVYSHTNTPTNLTITSSWLWNYNYLPSIQRQVMAGPVLGISKSFFDKKISTNTSIAYNITTINSKFNGDVYSIRFGGSYAYQKVHRISFNMAFVMKNTKTEILKQKKTTEYIGSLNYTYTFDRKKSWMHIKE